MSEPITEKNLTDALSHIELRLHRMWKDDIAAMARGQVSDLVARVEARVEGQIERIVGGRLQGSVQAHQASQKVLLTMVQSDRDFWIRYRDSLKDEIKAVCLETLQEFHVLDENGNAAKAGN
jgi:hypothetical protein